MSGGWTRETKYLVVIPAVLFLLAEAMAASSGPYRMGYNSDPAYPYLFSALNIVTFQTPRHTDHPGTTLQEIGAAVIYSKWLIQTLVGPWRNIDDAVLADPESYLHAISVVLNLLISCLIFACALRIYRYSGLLLPALLFEASVWLFSQTPIVQTRVSPEPLLIAAVCAFLLPFIPLLFEDKDSGRASKPAFGYTTGALFAFGMVTKVTFFPFAVFCLMLNGWQQRLRFGSAFACASLIFMLPIMPQIPQLAFWLWALAIHSGIYGHGSVGLPATAQYLSGLTMLFHAEPFLLPVLVYLAGVILWLSLARRTAADFENGKVSLRFLLLVFAVIVMQVAVTAKHAAHPHYILPALLTPAFAAALLCARFLKAKERRGPTIVVAVAGAAILLFGTMRSASATGRWLSASVAYREEVRKIAMTGPAGCMRIGFYESSLPAYALAFGNDFSGHVHASALEVLYPNSLTYNLYLDSFLTVGGTEAPFSSIQGRLESGECMLAQGDPQYGGARKLARWVTLTPIFAGKYESLYQMASKGIARATSKFAIPPGALVVEAEQFSAGGVVADTTNYGLGIGVITSPRYPTYAEYQIPIRQPGPYQLWARYATLLPRPMTIMVNGTVMTTNAFSEATGGFGPPDQAWIKVGTFEARAGNKLRIEGAGPFPHIDKFVLAPDPRGK